MEVVKAWWEGTKALFRSVDWTFVFDLHFWAGAFVGLVVFVVLLVLTDLVISVTRFYYRGIRRGIVSLQERLMVANAIEDALERLVLKGHLSKKAYRRWNGRLWRTCLKLRSDMTPRKRKLPPLYAEYVKIQIIKRLGNNPVAQFPDKGKPYQPTPETLRKILASRLKLKDATGESK